MKDGKDLFMSYIITSTTNASEHSERAFLGEMRQHFALCPFNQGHMLWTKEKGSLIRKVNDTNLEKKESVN